MLVLLDGFVSKRRPYCLNESIEKRPHLLCTNSKIPSNGEILSSAYISLQMSSSPLSRLTRLGGIEGDLPYSAGKERKENPL